MAPRGGSLGLSRGLSVGCRQGRNSGFFSFAFAPDIAGAWKRPGSQTIPPDGSHSAPWFHGRRGTAGCQGRAGTEPVGRQSEPCALHRRPGPRHLTHGAVLGGPPEASGREMRARGVCCIRSRTWGPQGHTATLAHVGMTLLCLPTGSGGFHGDFGFVSVSSAWFSSCRSRGPRAKC